MIMVTMIIEAQKEVYATKKLKKCNKNRSKIHVSRPENVSE